MRWAASPWKNAPAANSTPSLATVSWQHQCCCLRGINKAHEITLVYLAAQRDSARYIYPRDVYNNPKIYLYVLFCTRLTLGNSSRASATPLLFAKNTFIIHQKWGTRVIKTNRAADPLPPAITALTLLAARASAPYHQPPGRTTTTNNGPHMRRARFKICNFYDFCYWSKLFSLFVSRCGTRWTFDRDHPDGGELFCEEKRDLGWDFFMMEFKEEKRLDGERVNIGSREVRFITNLSLITLREPYIYYVMWYFVV